MGNFVEFVMKYNEFVDTKEKVRRLMIGFRPLEASVEQFQDMVESRLESMAESEINSVYRQFIQSNGCYHHRNEYKK